MILSSCESSGYWPAVMQALVAQSCPEGGVEVVLVDSGQSGEVHFKLLAPPKIHELTLLHLEGKRPGVLLNQACRRASGNILLFLGEGALPELGCLARHAALHQEGGGPKCVLGSFPTGRGAQRQRIQKELLATKPHGSWSSLQPGKLHDGSAFWPCNLSLSREVLMAAGGFFPNYHDALLMELDLGFRLASQGCRTLFDPEAACAFESSAVSDSFLRLGQSARRDRLRFQRRFGRDIARPGVARAAQDEKSLSLLEQTLDDLEEAGGGRDLWAQRALRVQLEAALQRLCWPYKAIQKRFLERRLQRVLRRILRTPREEAGPWLARPREACVDGVRI